MMEQGYRATGWLGLLLGTRVYFNFHPAAVATDELFLKQIDAVERDLGERGKRRLHEGVPPALAPRGPEPEPEPEPAPAPARVPSRPPAPAPAPAPAHPARSPSLKRSFAEPSSPALAIQPQNVEDTSLVEVLLAREDKIRQEAKEEKAAQEAKYEKLRQEMDAKIDAKVEQVREQMREDMKPKPALSPEQIDALQTRLEALHVAELLSDEELFALEDIVADFVELEASTMPAMRPITLEAVHTSPGDACAPAAKLLKLVALSERLATDAAFARQARRKFV